ncbi:hypothetical protein BDEG_27814 [Batrachochytrium dendrobatidis JEL423]|uniref:Uncharacterized protein n=1 Tax=Batrachochytrium dendrobatidis (strain JEL423) TaxID=403673 RepID=A0A177WXF4_BATDL|nr:hypothetical protein BDEG_24467 [Batrachochytrium dendrobatidis JEL423]OAJ44612.1 hypothetical protein BDEG_27814 [Batrachochytrium dendrobatidis JEL423]
MVGCTLQCALVGRFWNQNNYVECVSTLYTLYTVDLSLSDSGLEQDIAKWICDNLVKSPTLGQSDVGSARMDFYQAHICQPTISSILKWNNTYRKLTLVSD